MPLLSPARPRVRAATIRRPATWPSTTSALEPDSLKPLPERTAFKFGLQRTMLGAFVDRERGDQLAL